MRRTSSSLSRWTVASIFCAMLGLALAVPSLLASVRASDGLTATQGAVNGTPFTLLRPDGAAEPLPGVVVAHGYAASSELMEPLGRAIARAGYVVALADLPGHGANPAPLPTDPDELAAALGDVVDALSADESVDARRIAVIGHSMGAGAALRLAAEDPRVRATVAISLPSPYEPGRAADLLLLVGSAEPARFISAAQSQLQIEQPGAVEGVTYGAPGRGTAVRMTTIPGVEHLTIVWSQATVDATLAWLAPALTGGAGPVGVDRAWLWLLGMLAGGILLAVPLARVAFPVRVPEATSADLQRSSVRWWATTLVAFAGAIVGVLVARASGALLSAFPLAVGGYLLVWFAAAGICAGVGAVTLRLREQSAGRVPRAPARALLLASLTGTSRTWVAAAIVSVYSTLMLLIATRLTWAQADFVGPRWWAGLLLIPALLAYFVADELLVARRSGWVRGALVIVNRLIAVAVLLAAVPLLGAPAVLTLQVPLMLLLFIVVGVLAAVVRQRTSDVLSPALVQALPLAAIVAANFPIAG